MAGPNEMERALAARDRASQRLAALRRAAYAGNYDAPALERAICEYDQALAAVQRARAAGASAAGRAGAVVPEAFSRALEGGEPFVPTPAMRFVKWLVDTGRLSDR